MTKSKHSRITGNQREDDRSHSDCSKSRKQRLTHDPQSVGSIGLNTAGRAPGNKQVGSLRCCGRQAGQPSRRSFTQRVGSSIRYEASSPASFAKNSVSI